MTNKVDPGAPIANDLSNWVQAGQSLLDNLSSIFTPLSQGGEQRTEDLARRLLEASLNPQVLKDFRDHSVRLLSSLQKIAPAEIDQLIAQSKKGGEGILHLGKGISPETAKSAPQLAAKPEGGNEPLPLDRRGNPSSIIPSKQSLPSALTIAQATQKILQEVLQSIDLLGTAPAEESVHVQQLQGVYQKIKSVIDQLIKSTKDQTVNPIKAPFETDFTSRDPTRQSLKTAVKKAPSKESIPVPTFQAPTSERRKLENRATQSPADSQTKREPDVGLKAPSFGAKDRPTMPDRQDSPIRTVLPGMPFTPPAASQDSLRKAKKKRKFPWEREEYDDEDPPEKK